MLRVFGSRVRRRIFGPKRNEVIGEWRKVHNGEFHDLYSSCNIARVIKSRRTRWAGHVARMGDSCIQRFYWVSKGKRPLGRPRHRWEENIKMDLQEVECGDMDWIDLTQDRGR
jgi:hypothetical protein